jgi:hypothetical protein
LVDDLVIAYVAWNGKQNCIESAESKIL